MVADLSEKCASTSRCYVHVPGLINLNISRHSTLAGHTPLISLEKNNVKKSKFSEFMKRIQLLPRNIVMLNWSKTLQTFWLHFFSKFSEILLPLGDPLVATFNETRAPTSRKYVVEQVMVMPNWSKTFGIFWLHSFVSALKKKN